MRRLMTALLHPARCIGCGAQGHLWCATCSALRPDARLRDIGLPVVVGFTFDGAVRRTIIEWKEHDSRSARLRVAGWLDALVTPMLAADDAMLIAAVPSSRSADRLRGARPLYTVLQSVVPASRFTASLIAQRKRRDQAGLSRAERVENLQGSMVWRAALGAPVLVVDDVITTGSTMREARRAICAAETVPVLGCAIAQRERVKSVVSTQSGLR